MAFLVGSTEIEKMIKIHNNKTFYEKKTHKMFFILLLKHLFLHFEYNKIST